MVDDQSRIQLANTYDLLCKDGPTFEIDITQRYHKLDMYLYLSNMFYFHRFGLEENQSCLPQK